MAHCLVKGRKIEDVKIEESQGRFFGGPVLFVGRIS
jgi:hypothetical protein